MQNVLCNWSFEYIFIRILTACEHMKIGIYQTYICTPGLRQQGCPSSASSEYSFIESPIRYADNEGWDDCSSQSVTVLASMLCVCSVFEEIVWPDNTTYKAYTYWIKQMLQSHIGIVYWFVYYVFEASNIGVMVFAYWFFAAKSDLIWMR